MAYTFCPPDSLSCQDCHILASLINVSVGTPSEGCNFIHWCACHTAHSDQGSSCETSPAEGRAFKSYFKAEDSILGNKIIPSYWHRYGIQTHTCCFQELWAWTYMFKNLTNSFSRIQKYRIYIKVLEPELKDKAGSLTFLMHSLLYFLKKQQFRS